MVPARHASQLAGVAGRESYIHINMFYYTYVLLSQKDKKHYIGYTENLKKRFEEHQAGKVDSTKNRRPVELIYYEACLDEKSAIKREKYFKTGFGRRFLKDRLKLDILPESID